ncbi:hypothetical protein V6N13_087299 [Hibiscus sabdariffa]
MATQCASRTEELSGENGFQTSYPSWEPYVQGKQFLSNITTFMEQMLQGQGARHAYSSGRLWRGSPLRATGDRNSLLSMETHQNIPGTGYNMGSLWLLDADQKNHLYLLDWYYTSRAHQVPGYRSDTATRPLEPAELQHGGYWVPINTTHDDAKDEEYRPHLFDDGSRSHLEVSTSAPFFRESVLEHHDTNETVHHTRSCWWLRSGSHGTEPQTSFLEPPDFNHNSSNNPYERSVEHDQFLDRRDSRRLSRTTYLNDLDAGEDVSLHFDDIYSGPPETLAPNLSPPSI